MLCRFIRSFSSKSTWIPTNGVYPRGYLAGAVATGVKKDGRLDLSVVKSTTPCTVSAVFTTNKFAAAPVIQCKKLLDKPNFGVIVNSGCANACTGAKGLEDAHAMSVMATKTFSTTNEPAAFMVMSTGVIGQFLQMDKISQGISLLARQSLSEDSSVDGSGSQGTSNLLESGESMSSSHEDWLLCAKGIMTTDTFPKLKSKEFKMSNNKTFRVAGWSKGAGMIHPNMATMLSCLFTDAHVSKECMDKMVPWIADRSFNAISVDGDTSTNDTFMVLANGQSTVCIDDANSLEYNEFQSYLTEFATDLATLIVRDGEGATKFVKVSVKDAESFNDAKQVANAIVKSPLVKTAIYGRDANWGRIICAVGYSEAQNVVPEKVNLWLKSLESGKELHLFKNGAPFKVDEQIAAEILDDRDIELVISIGVGSSCHTMYTCDFSTEYVNINADYRS